MVAGRLENAPFSDSRQRRAGLLGRVALRRYDGGDFALSDRLDGCRTEQKKLSCSCRLCGAFSFFCLFFPYGNGAGTNHLFFPSLRLGRRFAKMPGRLFCVDGGRRMSVLRKAAKEAVGTGRFKRKRLILLKVAF